MRKLILGILLLLAVAGAAWWYFRSSGPQHPQGEEPRPVSVAPAVIGDLPVVVPALGTVVPENTALVRSRVNGVLMALHFTEGQLVKAGDLLAEIDPRPFEAALAKAKGTLASDEAQLKDARLDLDRFRKLVREGSVSQQQLQSQEALVGRYEGDVAADRAAVTDAALQLEYSRITAPISGRVGLKKADLGNMIQSLDSTGIVSITQENPTTVVFTLVERRIPAVQAGMAAQPGGLIAEAWDQNSTERLEAGRLLTLDNAIDTATGTVKAKALFPNERGRLFPNRFINVRLLVDTLHDVLLIPAAALQRDDKGYYVFVATPENKAAMRLIQIGYSTDEKIVVTQGLSAGDQVVIKGVDRLRDGTPVQPDTVSAQGASAPAGPAQDTPAHEKSSQDKPTQGKP